MLKYNKHLDESGHETIQQEHLQITAEPVTEEAEASSEHAGQISSVLEELTNCIDLELENGDKCLGKLTDVYEEDKEEDFEEETDSLAIVLADFFSVPNVSEQVGNSDQQEQIFSCDMDKKKRFSENDLKNQVMSTPKLNKGHSNVPSEIGSKTKEDLEVTLETNSETQPNYEPNSVDRVSEEICLAKVAQSSSKHAGSHETKNLNEMVKKASREVDVLTDSENEPDTWKFDWVRDVSSKIIMSGLHYECSECGFKSLQTSGRDAQREILDHLSELHLRRFREFTCMICRIQSRSLRNFLDHLKTKHNKKPSRDFRRAVTEIQNLSGKRKIIEVDLDIEEYVETPLKKFKCSTEDAKKREDEVMENHLKVLESNNDDSPNDKKIKKISSKQKIKCSTEHTKKREEEAIENHLKVFESNNDDSPKDKNHQPFNWHREMTKSVAISKNKIKCLQCSAQLCSSNSAVSHLESFHFKELGGLKCPHCEIICDNLINYNNHVRMKHRVKLTLSLNKKNLTAIDESSSMALINESLVHKNGTKRTDGFLWQNEVMKRIKVSRGIYHCSDCDFKSKPLSAGGGGDILNHIEALHMGITGYRCPECSTESNSFITFFQHLNKSHKIRLKLLQIL